ncbi:DUF3489 domain-containing protein [Hyphomonas sp.]|uniref:DUF3489 domain-containing protein n=1 Tax=Alphaproteobacteria TaxID=28211 RepID=UPI003265708F
MKFTDTQLILLTEAAKRDDRAIVIPDRIKGAAASKVLDRLIKAGVIEELASNKLPTLRRDDDGTQYALRITQLGVRAINADEPTAASRVVAKAGDRAGGNTKNPSGRTPRKAPRAIDSPDKSKADQHRERTQSAERGGGVGEGARVATAGKEGNHPVTGEAMQPGQRSGSKLAKVIGLLQRSNGASNDELCATTGWLPHTARAALTGLRKKGFTIERSAEPRGKETKTVYRIMGA